MFSRTATANESSDDPTPTSGAQHPQSPVANRSTTGLSNQTSFATSMMSGTAVPFGFKRVQVQPRRNESSDSPTTIGYAQHQEAPAASRGVVNFGIRNQTPSSQKFYVLTYDAQNWCHPETTDKITRLDGKSIPVGDGERVTDTQRSGTLGVYLSANDAVMMAHRWLYEQLKTIEPDVRQPLPRQDDSRCDKVTWKTSHWVQSPDGSRLNSVSDTFRNVRLSVLVTKSAVGILHTAAGKERQKEIVAGEREEGGRREVIDLTGTGDPVRERSAGKRKRDTQSEEQEDRGVETSGYAQE